MNEILIRFATPADLPAIVDIYNASIPGRLATADTEPVTLSERQAWFEKHSPDNFPIWVAEMSREVVGWSSLSPFYGRPAYRATAEISTYIANDWQRHGVATALREEVLRECPRLGICTLLAFVFAHNEPSIAFNEKYGFAVWGHLPRVAVLDDIERDLLIMGLRLETDN